MLVGIVVVLTTAAVAALGWCCKKVSDHDATERALIQRVASLEESVAAINNKPDQRFNRLTELLLDSALTRQNKSVWDCT